MKVYQWKGMIRVNYFIADLHFGHVNGLAYDNRPFLDIDTHDATLMKNWNNVVGMTDDIYILGDFSWHNATRTIEIMSELNGVKHLIVGNHDNKLLRNRDVQALFVEIAPYKELPLNNEQAIVLCHYPIVWFKNHFINWYHFYGHVHASFEHNMVESSIRQMEKLYLKPCHMLNVGAMLPYMHYTPITFEEAQAVIAQR